jgi:hypothetical protein
MSVVKTWEDATPEEQKKIAEEDRKLTSSDLYVLMNRKR